LSAQPSAESHFPIYFAIPSLYSNKILKILRVADRPSQGVKPAGQEVPGKGRVVYVLLKAKPLRRALSKRAGTTNNKKRQL
jgi:hypothetical protein